MHAIRTPSWNSRSRGRLPLARSTPTARPKTSNYVKGDVYVEKTKK